MSLSFYTNVIADVLSFVGRLGQLTDSGEMANAFAAYYNLLNLKEQAGIERALLSNIFSSGHFAEGQLHQLSDVVSKQNVWLAQSLRLSPPEQAAMLESRLQSTEASKALSFRETAFSHAANGGFDVDPTVWFKVQTQRIEVMRQIEDVTANLLLANAEKLEQDARKNWQRYMIVSLLALLASLAFAGAIAINMHRQFSDTLRKIAGMNGDLTQRLATRGKMSFPHLIAPITRCWKVFSISSRRLNKAPWFYPMPAAVLRRVIRTWPNARMNRQHQ